jgi:glycerol-3-phosphate acyltransferase PlsY
MSADLFDFGVLLILSYLAGSIPTGVILGHFKGVDPRSVGSGNIGATNVTRALGSRAGLWTLAGDLVKGLVPVLLASRLGFSWVEVSAIGLAAVIGHCFSIFLDFQGGKGVATSAGVFLALAPVPTAIAALVWAGVVAVTRVSSIGAFVALPVLLLLLLLPPITLSGYPVASGRTWLPLALLVAAVIVFRHRTNFRRMMEGRENRVSP